ncbi:ABC transporter ATP-binding protein [Desulfosarcina sp.]|uniref:ABC transporter ATP-binding protein n=1 Tax=Desulfosarcina sp. TaxID=2027861 RepID=UPI0039708132
MAIDLSVERVTKKFGDFTAVSEVSYTVEQGRFFSILGPSGCGKTTLLRMIAGFIEPTGGRILIRGTDMAGFPPNRRPVNLIFQHLALFPMMNVAQNIAFGLQRRKEKKAAINKKVTDILERVGLPGFANKKIDQLSGGQKQRVAIARCLVLDPAVLLLDEPLGALDLKLREQMKVELKKLQVQVGTTFIYITHDQSEALVMSDHVAVMNKGCFEQVDTPRNLYAHPKTPFVARFVGDNNAWNGTVTDRQEDRCILRTSDGQTFTAAATADLKPGTDVAFFIRPEAIIIAPDADLDHFNRLTVTIKAVLFDGANSRLLATPGKGKAELMIALPQNRQYDHLAAGDRIDIGWSARSISCFKAS